MDDVEKLQNSFPTGSNQAAGCHVGIKGVPRPPHPVAAGRPGGN
jgi:hypothetical protein